MAAYGDFRGLLLADYNDVLQNRFQKKNISQLRKETTYSGGFYQSASFDLKSQSGQAQSSNIQPTNPSKVKTIVTAASKTIVARPLTAYHSNSFNVLKQSIRSVPVENFENTIEDIDSFDSKIQGKKINRFPGKRFEIYQESQHPTSTLLKQVLTPSEDY